MGTYGLRASLPLGTYRRRRAACPQGPTYCTSYELYRTYRVLWQ